MSKKYTGKQIIKAGEKLIDKNISTSEFESAMDVLSYWRFSHEHALEEALKMLQKTTSKIDKSAIFAKRLKRHPSIVNKLKRFKQMKLKNMQDIGGCRAIVSSTKKITQVVRELKKKPEFRNLRGHTKYKDYIGSPKDDGYRGYHLIGQFDESADNKKSIEIQLRTKLQHDWATALEIVDLFTGQALKSNQGDENWKSFFKAISEQFALIESIHLFDIGQRNKLKEYSDKLRASQHTLDTCVTVQKLSEKLKVVKRFEAFANSLQIISNRLEVDSCDGYVLVEVDTSKHTVTSTLFESKNNKEAEEMYIQSEKSAAGKVGIVVALVSATAVGGIKEAYPNYFADSTEFLRHLLLVNAVDVVVKKPWWSYLITPA